MQKNAEVFMVMAKIMPLELGVAMLKNAIKEYETTKNTTDLLTATTVVSTKLLTQNTPTPELLKELDKIERGYNLLNNDFLKS